MKIFGKIVFALILLCSAVQAQYGWYKLPSGTNVQLNRIVSVGSGVWAVGITALSSGAPTTA